MLYNRSTNFIGGKKVIFRDAEYDNKSFKSIRPSTHSVDIEKFNSLRKIRNGLITFIQSTTIHGVVFLAKRGLHFGERYWQNNRWDYVKTNDTATVHLFDGEIYAQIINLSCAYDVYFHGYHEVPDISKQRYSFPAGDYTTVELLALEILTSDNAKSLTVRQRQCRFAHESDILETSPIYSFNLCQNECRLELALKTCGCIPHFYRSKLKNGRKHPVCGFDGIKCLQTIQDELISLKSKTIHIECNCLSNCDDPIYFVKAYRSRAWFLGSNLQWGNGEHPKMQLKRDLIFGITDFLVYIGGMAGFFLGCSLLNFTELIYYLTWRFCIDLLKK